MGCIYLIISKNKIKRGKIWGTARYRNQDAKKRHSGLTDQQGKIPKMNKCRKDRVLTVSESS